MRDTGDLTDAERAEARQVIGHGRMLGMSSGVSTQRQQRAEREQEREQAGHLALTAPPPPVDYHY